MLKNSAFLKHFSHYSSFLSTLECVPFGVFFHKEIHGLAPKADSVTVLMEKVAGIEGWEPGIFYLEVLIYVQNFNVCTPRAQ